MDDGNEALEKRKCLKIEPLSVKCRNYGQKGNCTATNSCKAYEVACNFCSKLGHFPKSLNCKKRRKMN